MHLLEEHYLSERSLGICSILKCINDLLDCHFSSCFLINCFPHFSIRLQGTHHVRSKWIWSPWSSFEGRGAGTDVHTIYVEKNERGERWRQTQMRTGDRTGRRIPHPFANLYHYLIAPENVFVNQIIHGRQRPLWRACTVVVPFWEGPSNVSSLRWGFSYKKEGTVEEVRSGMGIWHRLMESSYLQRSRLFGRIVWLHTTQPFRFFGIGHVRPLIPWKKEKKTLQGKIIKVSSLNVRMSKLCRLETL